MGGWIREPIQTSAILSTILYAVSAALTAVWLFGANGRFGSYTGGLTEFLDEIFGMGRHADATFWLGLVLFFFVPLAAGLALRTWHWVWLSILALVGAELLTWIPHLLAGERPVPVAAIPWVVALYGLPAALGATIGTWIGRHLLRPRTL